MTETYNTFFLGNSDNIKTGNYSVKDLSFISGLVYTTIYKVNNTYTTNQNSYGFSELKPVELSILATIKGLYPILSNVNEFSNFSVNTTKYDIGYNHILKLIFNRFSVISDNKLYYFKTVYTPIISTTYKGFAKTEYKPIWFNTVKYSLIPILFKLYEFSKIEPFTVNYIENNGITLEIKDSKIIIKLLRDNRLVYYYEFDSDYLSGLLYTENYNKRLLEYLVKSIKRLGI